MPKSGVYQILCTVTGHRYIGSAEDIESRWGSHKRELRRGKHKNKALQYAWGLFGEAAFVFTILEETSDLVAREDHFLETIKPEFNVLSKGGERSPGRQEKTVKCIRLDSVIDNQLREFCSVTKKSMSSVVEHALSEYFETHGYTVRYVLNVSNDAYCLLKYQQENMTIVDMQPINGVPLEKIRQEYAAKFNSPIELHCIDKGATL